MPRSFPLPNVICIGAAQGRCYPSGSQVRTFLAAQRKVQHPLGDVEREVLRPPFPGLVVHGEREHGRVGGVAHGRVEKGYGQVARIGAARAALGQRLRRLGGHQARPLGTGVRSAVSGEWVRALRAALPKRRVGEV